MTDGEPASPEQTFMSRKKRCILILLGLFVIIILALIFLLELGAVIGQPAASLDDPIAASFATASDTRR